MKNFTNDTWNSLFRYIAAGVLLGIFTFLVVKGLAPATDLVTIIVTLLSGLGVVHAQKLQVNTNNSTPAVTNNASTSTGSNTSNTH